MRLILLLLLLGAGVVGAWAESNDIAHVDCEPGRLVIYPGKAEVTFAELRQMSNVFVELLDQIEANRSQRSLVVMVRPGSVVMYREVRNLIGRRQINATYEPVDANFKVEWSEALQALATPPPRTTNAVVQIVPSTQPVFQPPIAATFPEDSALAKAELVLAPAELLAKLKSQRSALRDFEATGTEFRGAFDSELRVSYQAEGHLIRVERLSLGRNEQTIFDGEALWVGGGSLFRKFPTRAGPHTTWLPDWHAFAGTNFVFRQTEQWTIAEWSWQTDGGRTLGKIFQDPGFRKEITELEIAMNHVRKKRGLPPMDALDSSTKAKSISTNQTPQARTNRYWIRRDNGFCYRRDTLDEAGKVLSGWRFHEVNINVGLPTARFHPNLKGKQVIEAGKTPTAEVLEAEYDALLKEAPNVAIATAFGGKHRPPLAVQQMKSSMFLECRNNELFIVDRVGLEKQLVGAAPGAVVGNETYTVDPRLLMVGVLSLKPCPEVRGESLADLQNPKPDSPYRAWLAGLDKETHHIRFLVRDDSFAVYRAARAVATAAGFDTVWELIGPDEPLKFGRGPR